MGHEPEITRHAAALWEASAARKGIQPLTETDPTLAVDDAYAIQLANVARAVAQGRTVVGHKVGLTSRAMQEMLGVDEPDFGVLLDDMVLGNGTIVSTEPLLHPRVEAEIAFRLARDLEGPGVTTDGALDALDVAIPALEIIDSRIVDWKIRLVDTIADNGSSALVVLGAARRRSTASTCPASRWRSSTTVPSSRPGPARRCSVIPRRASRGSRTSSPSSTGRSVRVRSSCRVRSTARSTCATVTTCARSSPASVT